MVDGTDLKIVTSLQNNSRTPLMHIAKSLKLSESAIRKRVRNLEQRGVIKQYSLVLDHSKVGYENIALVGVDVKPEMYLEVAKRLKKIEGIKYVASTTGDHMFMLEIVAKDNAHLSEVCDKVKYIDGVTRICPAIVKDTIKGSL